MSTSPESEFDLEKLFLPAWAQDAPGTNRYANFAGEERRERRDDDRNRPRPPRRDAPRGSGPPGDRQRRPGSGFGHGRDRGPGSRDRQGQEPRREAPPLVPPPEIIVSLLPDEKGVESLARQIRMAGRAYPLFDIARLILQKPERQQVRFEVKKDAEGKTIQPLFVCALDDTLWLSEDEVVQHVLGKHFGTFYQAERTATDPPKGVYTFVAQCGMSGAILGPPNYHDYQNQLRKLHTERFSRLPFEAFKARVKIVKDEAIVKKWIEDHSFKTEYNCLNVPDALKLSSREEVEKHFRTVHLPNLIKSVDSHVVSGAAARQIRCPGLQRALREAAEDQRRFPLKLATVLSQQFASHGLQFFKVNRTVTHVSVARPRYLDMEATPVSEGVKKIVEFINASPKCTRKKLFASLAPTPAPVAAVATPAPAAQGEVPAAAAPTPAAPESTPEQTALASDLHWLIHEGHVIEFATGVLETAKKPLPRPPKPEKKVEPAAAAVAASPAAVAEVPDLSTDAQEAEHAVVTDTGETPPTAEASAPVTTEAAQSTPATENAGAPG
ncbi:MAG TPA: hypothetical protein VGO67_10285 [Verrucomicrobiae bacterium]|jgi:hypothetical protein